MQKIRAQEEKKEKQGKMDKSVRFEKRKVTFDLVFWHRFFWFLLILTLIPLALISFYNHASADDFAFSNYPHHAWAETGNLLAFFGGCLKQLHWSYTSWQGCFTAVILGALDPVAFGDSWYALVAYLTIGSLIISNLIFWRFLFRDRSASEEEQKKRRMLADVSSCVTAIAMIQLVPRAMDMFFWWDGSVNYLPFFAIMLLLSALISKLWREEALPLWQVALACVLSFLVMGGNYATALENILLLTVMGLAMLVLRKKGKIPYLFIFISGAAGLLTSVLAPGNAVRMAQEGGSGTSSIVQTVIHSIALAGQSIQQQMGILFILTGALLVPVFWTVTGLHRMEKASGEKRKRNLFSIPAPLVLGTAFLLYAASYAPTVYVYGDGGPMRVEDVRFFYLVWLSVLCELFLVGKIRCTFSQNQEDRNEYHSVTEKEWQSRWNFSVLAMIVLFIGIYYVLPRENRETLTSLCAARSLLIGEAQRYDEEMKERSEILNDPETRGQAVEICAVSERPYLLFLYGLELTEDPDYWINQTVAEYYDKESVTLVTGE